MRIGFASDIHRLVEGRRFVLAGVTIPFELGEQAHSDGDVVYHAVAESILCCRLRARSNRTLRPC